ncbi:hypothetical protein Ahy_A08g037974 isoform A [Arachis hypogaea]|uniref:Yippee domain-containing protein n=1 Tax=Arachis hypogaea TaxID=3818 RepID=A0A445BSA6_ARAHY|nr:hypothetical protein Ahy_A08g037974 isoform A [Arachis hypogaea]
MAELIGPRLYSCCNCRNHVSLHDDIISKAFQAEWGDFRNGKYSGNAVNHWNPVNSVVQLTILWSSDRVKLMVIMSILGYLFFHLDFTCIPTIGISLLTLICQLHFSLVLHLAKALLDQGRNGRAFLFSHAMNVVTGPKEDRHLMTGLHTVADVYCGDCREVLGWKYEKAYEASQKYKEGKFILEKSKIVRENW